jgi:hypothetical protein
VLDHVAPELPRGANDADLHCLRPVARRRREPAGVRLAGCELVVRLVTRPCERMSGEYQDFPAGRLPGGDPPRSQPKKPAIVAPEQILARDGTAAERDRWDENACKQGSS